MKVPFKKPPIKKEFLPLIPTTRAERFTKRQELHEQIVQECTEKEVPKIRKTPITFEDKVNESSKKFAKPFSKINFRSKFQRIDSIASLIVGSCINRNQQKQCGSGYMKNNEELGNEIMNVLNLIKDRIENKLNVDFNLLQYPMPVNLIEDDEDMKTCKLFKNKNTTIWDLLEDDTTKLAYGIIGESTGRGFERIREKYNKIQPTNPLPSGYHLNKKLPVSIVSFEHDLIGSSKSLVSSNVKEEILLGFHQNNDEFIKSEEDAVQMFCGINVNENEKKSNDNITKIVGANIESTYIEMVQLMLKKHAAKGHSLANGDDEVIIINSFDGAEAFKSRKNVNSVVSFSSSLLTSKMIYNDQIKAGESFNILTWSQAMGKETFGLIQKVLGPKYWEERHSLSIGKTSLPDVPDSKVWIYDVHDGKMLYSLLQHSMWNRRHNPFLLCKCTRNAGLNEIEGDTHHCIMINDDEYTNLFHRSKRRFDSKKYNEAKHRDWCDLNNAGITHFGVNPTLFNVSTIRFDTFHCMCAVTRTIMNFTRNFILKQRLECREEFTQNVLSEFLSPYHIYCWNNKCNFSAFKGNDLKEFILNSHKISTFVEKKFVKTTENESLVGTLRVLQSIFSFVRISKITNEKEYVDVKMKQFEKDVCLLFKYGRNTFFAKQDVSFYFHTLRFYLPEIAKKTFHNHQLGLGIFTMQGYKRRNKESKNTINRFCTSQHTSNTILVNNIRRLLYVFLLENNAY